MTLYEPKTNVTHTALDQTGSSAGVTGDQRQGSALAVIVYQDGADATIATETTLIDPPAGATGAATTVSGSMSVQGTVKLH